MDASRYSESGLIADLNRRIAELKAELANEKELCAADRFHHFGAGWMEASAEYQGRVQELEAALQSIADLNHSAHNFDDARNIAAGIMPQPPQQEGEKG